MKRPNYIPDGYTETFYIEDVAGVFDEPVRFTARPMLVEEVAALNGKLGAVKQDTYERLCASKVEEHVVEWDITAPDGEPVEVNEANALRLPPLLFGAMFAMIVGTRPSDVDPLWSEAEKDKEKDLRLKSAVSGKDVGVARHEGHEGN